MKAKRFVVEFLTSGAWKLARAFPSLDAARLYCVSSRGFLAARVVEVAYVCTPGGFLCPSTGMPAAAWTVRKTVLFSHSA